MPVRLIVAYTLIALMIVAAVAGIARFRYLSLDKRRRDRPRRR